MQREDLTVLAYRFEGDSFCRAARFDGLNVQLTREIATRDARAQLVDFGHFQVHRRFENPLASLAYKRLLRFGLPTGLQFSLEVLSFGMFLMIVGRLGTVQLAATSLAFNLNGLVFMPTLGMGMGVSSLVARYLGAEQPAHAERAVASGLWLCSGYLLLWTCLYLGVPHLLLTPYAAGARDAASLAPVTATAAVLLRYVAAYSFFDMVNVITAAGLKGAGDTRYPLWVTIALAWVVLLPPTYAACTWLAPGPALHVSWCAAAAYVFGIGLLMRRRFRTGAWKSLRVIEAHQPLIEEPAA